MSLENPNLNNDGHEDGPNVNAENKTEEIFDSVEDMTKKSEEAALELANTIESSSLPPEQKEKFRKRLERSLKKIVRIFTFATALTGVAGTINYQLTRYSVETSIAEDGSPTYKHQDAETTRIINIMSGKEQITDMDRRGMLIGYLAEKLDYFHKEGLHKDISQQDFDNMSVIELNEKAKELIGLSRESDVSVIDPTPGEFDRELYDALWKLEQENGNPKVRFRLASVAQSSNPKNTDRSFYNGFSNTSFIDVGTNQMTIDHYIAELSHAKQYNENPIYSTYAHYRDKFKTFKRAVAELIDLENKGIKYDAKKTVADAYNKLYDEEGALEHHAHEIIEPQLKKQFESLIPQRILRKKEGVASLERVNKVFTDIDTEEKQSLDKLHSSYLSKIESIDSKDLLEIEKIQKEYTNEIEKLKKAFEARRIKAMYDNLKKN